MILEILQKAQYYSIIVLYSLQGNRLVFPVEQSEFSTSMIQFDLDFEGQDSIQFSISFLFSWVASHYSDALYMHFWVLTWETRQWKNVFLNLQVIAKESRVQILRWCQNQQIVFLFFFFFSVMSVASSVIPHILSVPHVFAFAALTCFIISRLCALKRPFSHCQTVFTLVRIPACVSLCEPYHLYYCLSVPKLDWLNILRVTICLWVCSLGPTPVSSWHFLGFNTDMHLFGLIGMLRHSEKK